MYTRICLGMLNDLLYIIKWEFLFNYILLWYGNINRLLQCNVPNNQKDTKTEWKWDGKKMRNNKKKKKTGKRRNDEQKHTETEMDEWWEKEREGEVEEHTKVCE